MQTDKTFECETCGKIDIAYMNGYLIGDRMLEDVNIECKIVEGKISFSFQEWQKAYTDKLNNKYWMDLAEKKFSKVDWLMCPKCNEDVENSFYEE